MGTLSGQKFDQTKYEQVKYNMLKNLKKLINRYGPDAEKVIHGRALKTALNSTEMKENRIREIIHQALSEKKEFPDLTGDGKVTKADILKGRGVELDEDLDLGHTDNEPHMLKADLYKIGKYAMELYQMVDKFEGQGEVDFPHWWQAKIIKAASMISSAKHYLEFELKEPQVDAMVDVASDEEVIDDAPMMENIGKDEILAGRLYKIKNFVQPAFYQKVRMMINNGDLEKAEEFISRMEPVSAKKDTEFAAMKGKLDSLEEVIDEKKLKTESVKDPITKTQVLGLVKAKQIQKSLEDKGYVLGKDFIVTQDFKNKKIFNISPIDKKKVEESGNKMDWKKMGFKSEKEYNDFLKSKMDSLLGKIKNDPKLLNVFKRLKDR